MIANNHHHWANIMSALHDPHDPVALDTETTGLRLEQGDEMRGFSLSVDRESWYVPCSHPNSENMPPELALQIMERIAEHDTVVFWNSSFDRTVISRAMDIEFAASQMYDALVVDWLMSESASHHLKDVGARLFGEDAKDEQLALRKLFRGESVSDIYADLRRAYLDEVGAPRLPKGVGGDLLVTARDLAAKSKRDWSTVTAEEIGAYAAKDADLTLRIYWYQQSWLENNPDYIPGIPREMEVEDLGYQMRKRGMRIDQAKARESLNATLERIEELAALWPETNLKAPAQVSKLIYEEWGLPCTRKTKSGNPSTDKFALSALSYDPRVASLTEYRKLTKMVDAFYVPLLNKLGDDGRIHPSWNPHRTVTGRWSCSNPNLQQLPREGGVRDIFVPAPGHVFVSADLPNAELRLAAILSNEELWMDAFRNGADLHQEMADAAGITRVVAKTTNFSSLYGVGPRKLAETLAQGTGRVPDVAAARKALNAYWKAVPRVKRLMDGLGESWARYGKLPIRPWPGRFRHRMNGRTGFPEPGYKALNSIIQGSVGEAVKDWMLELQDQGFGQYIVAQVHDSLVLEVPDDPEEIHRARLALQLCWDAINPFNQLPWPLDVKVGTM